MTFDIVSWPMLALALLIFGFAPGVALRLIVLAFPRGDPRRHELLGELHAVPRFERPFWVVEQLELALFEGLGDRLADWRTKRILSKASSLAWDDSSGVGIAFFRGKTLLRNPEDVQGPVVILSKSQWRNTVEAIQRGDWDHVIDDPSVTSVAFVLGAEVLRAVPNQEPE
jgi:hypothetical protein